MVLNGAPVGLPDPWYDIPQDTTLTVDNQATTLLQNDSDPEGSSITATLVTNPSNGSLSSFSSDGTFTYVPDSGFTGFDQFTYQVSDGTDSSQPIAASIAVGGNFGPRTNLDARSQGSALLDGGLSRQELLAPTASLVYQSNTVPAPIVVLETSLQSGSSVPDEIRVQLTFNGTAGTTYSYATNGLSAGDTLRFALQADATALATGRYDYSIDLTAVLGGNPTVHTFTGSHDVVNRSVSSHPFGRGWQLAGLDELVVDTNGVLSVRSDGTSHWFAEDSSGGYLHAPGDVLFSTLVQNANQTFTLTDKHGTQADFSSSGQLTSRTDPNGNTTSYTYTAGLLTQITDPFARNTTFGYTNGQLTSVTDVAGRTASLSYDASGHLTGITQPDPDGTGSLTSPVTSFSYNATTHRMSQRTDPLNDATSFTFGTHGRLTRITHPDNATWQLTSLQTIGLPSGTSGNSLTAADPVGLVTDQRSSQSTFRTDRFGNLIEWNDPLSQQTLTVRNPDGLPIQVTQPDPDGVTDPLESPVYVYGYDSAGNQVYHRNPEGNESLWTYTTTLNLPATATDELNRVTSFAYDNDGNLTSRADPAGYATSYSYNSQGQVTSVTQPDPDGAGPLSASVTSMAYDSAGRLVTLTNPGSSTRTFTYNTADQQTSMTDELGNTATFVVDALDRMTSHTDREGATTSYAYDALGHLIQETDALGNVTDHQYNNRGWLTKTFGPDPDGTGPLVRPESTFGYDAGGLLTSVGEPAYMGMTARFNQYDAAGRLTSTGYGGTYQVTTFEHDNLDRVTKIEDALDHATWFEYNFRGQKTQVFQEDDNIFPMGDPTGLTTLHSFDAAGQLIEVTNPRGYTTSLVYDARGLLVTRFDPDPDGNDPNTTGPQFQPWATFTYDRAGRLIETADVLHRETTRQYDSNNRVTRVTLPDPDGTGPLARPYTTFTYDAAGRLTAQTDPLSRVTSFAFDKEGRLTSRTDPDPDGIGSLSSPVVTLTYNVLGSLLTQTDPLGSVTSLEYDHLQRTTKVIQPDPDGAGPLTAPTTTYAYNSGGLLDKVTDPLGRQTTFGYDDQGRRTNVTDHLGNETVYAHDLVGQVTSVTSPDPDGTGPLTAPVTTYVFDEFGRLKQVIDPNGEDTSYTYDDAGNLLTLTDPVGNETSFAYDGLNRLTIETNELDDTRSFDYDLVGNLTRQTDRNGRVRRFEYDGLDRRVTEQWRSDADPGPELAIATDTQGGTTDEVQRVGFTADMFSGGTFTLSVGGQTTSTLSFNATAAQVQTALELLSTVGTGNVLVTKLQDSYSTQEWNLEFQGTLAETNLSQTTVDSANVWTMMFPATDIEATDTNGGMSNNEVQTVTLASATGGTFRLALDGYVTAAIVYNATASQVDASLESLNSVDQINVTGSAGGPWTVTFVGSHAAKDVSRMDGDVTAATAGALVRTATYSFDAAGQLTSASDPDSSYTYTRDDLGRVLSVDNNGTSGVPRVVLTNSYDATGNRTGLSATVAGTSDFQNAYTFDTLGRLARLDQTGQTGGNSVAEKRVDLAHNAVGQFTSIARYKDTDGGSTHEVATATYSHDTLARLTGLAYAKGGTNLFTPYSWTFDSLSSPGSGTALSGIDSRVAATAALPAFSGLGRATQMVSQDGTSDYSYDSTSQLTGAVHSFQTNESYSYDANGNRTMTGYQTGTNNRLTNDGTFSYQYDDEGNRTRRTNSSTGAVTEYEWDYRNRLVEVTEKTSQGSVTQLVQYTYDIFNRRIARAVDTSSPFDMQDAAIERYILDDANGVSSPDGGNVVLDFVDPDGTSGSQPVALSKRYLFGQAVDQILAQEDVTKTLNDAARILWPLVDNLGTVRDLAKQDGTIATHFQFDTFGQVVSGNTALTRYLYTSREFDTATDLQFNRARWFDPAVGKWLSEDPIGFVAGDANLGRYLENESTGATDPSGLEDHLPWGPNTPNPPTIDDIAKQGVGAVEVPVSVGQPRRQIPVAPLPNLPNAPAIQPDSDIYPPLPPIYVGGMILPPGPGGLPQEWQLDPRHLYPHGDRFRHPGGESLDWHPGRPGQPGWGGEDHWHHNEEKDHLKPGDEIPDPPSGVSERIILIGLGGTLVLVTLGEDIVTFGVGIWNDVPTLGLGAAMIGKGFAF